MIVRWLTGWLTGAAIVVGAALVGLVAWIGGRKGLANRAESMCDVELDNHLGCGAYRMSRKLWLPSFESRLLGNSVEPIVVRHPLEAIVALGWVVVVPKMRPPDSGAGITGGTIERPGSKARIRDRRW